ncbi:MAG: hypothetical protein ACE5MG_10405, partial [Candidatus Methylomirabilales bacterium]
PIGDSAAFFHCRAAASAEELSWRRNLFRMGKFLYQAIVTNLHLTPALPSEHQIQTDARS